jgi:hypothetical protein
MSSMHWLMRRFNAPSTFSKRIKKSIPSVRAQYPQLQHSNLALPALHEARHNLRNSLANLLYLMPKGGK